MDLVTSDVGVGLGVEKKGQKTGPGGGRMDLGEKSGEIDLKVK